MLYEYSIISRVSCSLLHISFSLLDMSCGKETSKHYFSRTTTITSAYRMLCSSGHYITTCPQDEGITIFLHV